MKPYLFFVSCVAAAVALIACKSSTDADSTSSAAVDSADLAQSQSALVVSTVSGATFVANSSISAQAAATALTGSMQPAGCATSTVTGNKAVYTFKDCSGRYDLVSINGTLTATYTATLTSVGVVLAASSLEVGNATVDVDVKATYAQSATSQSVTVESNSSAQGVRGNAVTVDGSYTASWTTSCLSLSGAWSTDFDGLTWKTSVTDFSVCADACPAAGGELSYSGPAGRTLTLSFDGGAAVGYSDSNGDTGDVTLSCP